MLFECCVDVCCEMVIASETEREMANMTRKLAVSTLESARFIAVQR